MAVQRRRRQRRKRRRRQQGGGWWQDLKRNTCQGYKESRDVIKQNKALQRLLSHPTRPWYP